MSKRLKDYLCEPPGGAGAQSDFLAGCGVFAHLRPSGASGSAGTQSPELRTCAPDRSQTARERNSSSTTGVSALRSCASEKYTPEKNEAGCSTIWTHRARLLIGDLTDDELSVTLTDFFEETASTLEYEQNRPQAEAEQHAYGALVFCMLERGMDVRVVP